jgi:hypothetical protein
VSPYVITSYISLWGTIPYHFMHPHYHEVSYIYHFLHTHHNVSPYLITFYISLSGIITYNYLITSCILITMRYHTISLPAYSCCFYGPHYNWL